MFVFVGNQTPQLFVYYDNLQLSHVHSPVLEETSYYPYGMTMSGIGFRASDKLENNRKTFQGQEYNDDLDVDMYEFKYRMDDPQTGRFWQVDPLADKYEYNSTYAFSENKVTGHVELEGLEASSINAIVPNTSHHKDNTSSISLNLDAIMKPSSNTSIDVNNSSKDTYGIFSAVQKMQDPSNTTANDLNFVNSVTETTISSSSSIVELKGGTKLLAITSTCTSTTVSFDIDKISSISTTSTSSTSYSPIENVDPKNNSITISTKPSLEITNPTKTTQLALDKDLSKNLSHLSSTLESKQFLQ